MFDIFFISTNKNHTYLKKLKNKFVFVKHAATVLEAQQLSLTKMFWVVYDDLIIDAKFDFDHTIPKWDHQYVHSFKNADDTYLGISLIPKDRYISSKEIEYRMFLNRKEWNIVASSNKPYDIFEIDSYDDYLNALKNTTTEMFWVTGKNIKSVDSFKFDLTFSDRYSKEENHAFLHDINGVKQYDGIFLLSKNKPVSRREIESRFLVDKKEWDIVASSNKPYDIFEIDSYDDYLNALENTTTEMFWATSTRLKIDSMFDMSLFFEDRTDTFLYERNNNHAFLHDINGIKTYHGIFLLSKNKPVSKREIESHFIVDKKEWDIVASSNKPYDIFEIDSYDDYLNALKNTTTEMFWMTGKNIIAIENFKFDIYFDDRDDKFLYERNENHAFLHDINGVKQYHGIFLLSKNKSVSKREIESRFLVNKKEWNIVVSVNRPYDIFEIDSYDDYLNAVENTTTEMFWMTSRKIMAVKDFKFDIYFDDRDDEFLFERNENHAFLHDIDGVKQYDGIFLLPKNKPVSRREIESRFLVDKKEWDIVASTNKPYDTFTVDTYTDYLNAVEKATTELFWMIPAEVSIEPEFDMNLFFEDRTDTFLYDRTIHHSFKHQFRDELNYNGLCLVAKNLPLSTKEINYRFIINSKKYDTVATKLKPYDIIFISYNEPTADENFADLLKLYPRAKRIHGVKGIHQAHIKAAQMAETGMFWVVDGDAKIVEDFKFDYQVSVWNYNTVHVWRSRNPINDLEYGYGGVKLLPRQLTLNMNIASTDMTTSISDSFKIIDSVSNITSFNTDAFSTWKSAFRECAKLASKSITSQIDEETEQRLNVWCTQGADKLFGDVAIAGALAGRKFGETHSAELYKINDFDWLYKVFESKF